jgi:hypothetical protein
MVPPALRVRARHRTCGAITVHPPPLPTVPLVTTWLTVMLAASRPCVPFTITTSSARVGAVFWTRIL